MGNQSGIKAGARVTVSPSKRGGGRARAGTVQSLTRSGKSARVKMGRGKNAVTRTIPLSRLRPRG